MERRSAEKVLKASLQAGAIYCLGVAFAHLVRVKVPGLYVYYSIPSQGYQDQVIGTLAFGWAVFLWAASGGRQTRQMLLPAVFTAGLGGVAGLTVINLSSELAALAKPIDLAVFWLETGLLAGYLGWLLMWSMRRRVR